MNMSTFEQFVGLPRTSEEMASLLAGWRETIESLGNSQEVISS